jgi:diguanylate cyclase (GGDEF)-like protein
MRSFVALCVVVLPPLRSVAASVPGLASHPRAFVSPATLSLFFITSLSVRIASAMIGLSFLSMAATIATALAQSAKGLPRRRILISVAFCASVAGLASLLSAALASGFHPGLVDKLPLASALFSVLLAVLLPRLLSLLRSNARELESTTESARRSEARFLSNAQYTTDAFIHLEAIRAPSGRIEDFLFTYINPNAEKLIDKTSSQVLGARLSQILPIPPTGPLFEKFCQVVLSGTPLLHEFPLDAGDPDSPWMRHLVTRLDDGLAITASDITATKREVREFLREDQFDPLTGLPNSLILHDRIEQAIARAVRYRDKVAVFIINIDNFQQLNDRYGREFGDEVLRITATRLRSTIRATDSVIRLDADEFVVILPEIKLEIDVRRTAATLLANLRQPIVHDGAANLRTINITSTLGAAIYPESALTTEALLAAADAAMARAKAHGKNQYILYDPVIDAPPAGDPPTRSRSAEGIADSSQEAGPGILPRRRPFRRQGQAHRSASQRRFNP